jgi:hypothetical protein
VNDFDEHKWSAGQRALDLRIAQQFDGLEGSRAVHEATGAAIESWTASAQELAADLGASVAQLEHAGRRAHWQAELTRLGLSAPAPVAKVDKPETSLPPVTPAPAFTPPKGGKHSGR